MKFSILFRSALFIILMYTGFVCSANTSIVVLGDSLSAGYGLNQNESWVDILAEKLKSQGIAASVTNASTSGATSADGLNVLSSVLERYHPNILILALGSNDGLRGNSVSLLQKNLSDIISTTQKTGCKVLLVGFKMPPNYGASYSTAFEAVFPKLSKEYNVPLVPFLLAGFESDLTYFQDDRLHPTAKAQERIYSNVWAQLKGMLGETR